MNQTDLLNFFSRAIKPVKDRLLLMVGRAIITALNDSKPIQEAQVKALSGESLEKIQRFQDFGFNSVVPPGTEGILLSLAGARGNSVIVGTEHRDHRPQGWAVGEAGMYNVEAMIAILRLGGKLEIKNTTDDFVTVLSDACQWLIEARTLTIFGYQPLLDPVALTRFILIKARLDTFKP